MTTYIALLRGINVGEHNRIKMADLVDLLNLNEFKNVTTYIQSGNVRLSSIEKNTQVLENKISKLIYERFEYTIKIFIIAKTDLNLIFNKNPFLKENKSLDISKLHVTILDTVPTNDQILHLKEFSTDFKDVYSIINNVIYLYCPNGFGKTKLTSTFFEKKLACKSTTRNWKTIIKLIEITN